MALFRQGSVDVVVSNNAIGRSAAPAECLREAARVLKPGGRLLIFEEGSLESPFAAALRSLPQFGPVDVDRKWATYPLQPYCIGVSVRAADQARGAQRLPCVARRLCASAEAPLRARQAPSPSTRDTDGIKAEKPSVKKGRGFGN